MVPGLRRSRPDLPCRPEGSRCGRVHEPVDVPADYVRHPKRHEPVVGAGPHLLPDAHIWHATLRRMSAATRTACRSDPRLEVGDALVVFEGPILPDADTDQPGCAINLETLTLPSASHHRWVRGQGRHVQSLERAEDARRRHPAMRAARSWKGRAKRSRVANSGRVPLRSPAWSAPSAKICGRRPARRICP
jgi:hypothetical protein